MQQGKHVRSLRRFDVLTRKLRALEAVFALFGPSGGSCALHEANAHALGAHEVDGGVYGECVGVRVALRHIDRLEIGVVVLCRYGGRVWVVEELKRVVSGEPWFMLS